MTERRPNIIWYCTDQQRFDTIHGLGNQHINTPNLDRFMKTAVTFTHAHCQAPICTASRSSFLTGMYPSHVRNTRNGNGTVSPDVEERLITRKLADDGYDCGLVGKLHLPLLVALQRGERGVVRRRAQGGAAPRDALR